MNAFTDVSATIFVRVEFCEEGLLKERLPVLYFTMGILILGAQDGYAVTCNLRGGGGGGGR